MAEGLLLRDKRRLPRKELIYYLPVLNTRNGLELGRMVDIHAEGFLLMGADFLTPGDRYEAAIQLPKKLKEAGGAAEVRVSCEAMWNRPGFNDNCRETGLKFLEVGAAERAIIERLIEFYALPDGNLGIFNE